MLRQEDKQLDPALIAATRIYQAETVLDPDGVYEELMGELVFRGQLPERSYWVSINDRGEVTLGPGERVARFQLLHEYYELDRTHLLGVDVEEILVPGLDSDKGYQQVVDISSNMIYLTGLRDVTFSRIITILRNHYKRAGYDF
jgi:hypothetical protein